MTTTRRSHADCTHPRTPAARAICRKAADSGRTHDEQVKLIIRDNRTASRKAIIEKKITEYSALDYTFESITCWKCSGTGHLPHHASVHGGVCYPCGGAGKTLTRSGKAAKKKHDAWVAEHLMIAVTDVEVGMKIKPSPREGFKTITAKGEPKTNGRSRIGGEDAPWIDHVVIVFETLKSGSYALITTSTVQRAATPEERNELIRHIASLKGTILTPR